LVLLQRDTPYICAKPETLDKEIPCARGTAHCIAYRSDLPSWQGVASFVRCCLTAQGLFMDLVNDASKICAHNYITGYTISESQVVISCLRFYYIRWHHASSEYIWRTSKELLFTWSTTV